MKAADSTLETNHTQLDIDVHNCQTINWSNQAVNKPTRHVFLLLYMNVLIITSILRLVQTNFLFPVALPTHSCLGLLEATVHVQRSCLTAYTDDNIVY